MADGRPVDAEGVARRLFPEVDSLVLSRERIAREQARTQAEVDAVRERLAVVTRVGLQAEAEALAAGQPVVDDGERERLPRELAALERRLAAYGEAAQIVEQELAELRLANQGTWGEAQAVAVREAAERVEAARVELADAEALAAWIMAPVPAFLSPETRELGLAMSIASEERHRALAVTRAANKSTPQSDAALAQRVRLAELERGARRR